MSLTFFEIEVMSLLPCHTNLICIFFPNLSLIQIVTTTNHICYIKLIVSGLDYTVDALPRQVLEKALNASERSAGRLYATQFLLVLLRAKIPNFEVWGLPLLIKQTRDKERKVILTALEILDEACHDRVSKLEKCFIILQSS